MHYSYSYIIYLTFLYRHEPDLVLVYSYIAFLWHYHC